MRHTFLAVFFAMVAIMISGCTIQRKLIKIPRTQENLQGFRDCQRTVAVAIGYDSRGIEKLKAQCLNSLESSFEIVTTTNDTEQFEPPGCQELEVIIENGIYSYYYLCK